MLDLKFIRDNQELVHKKAEEKGFKVEVKKIVELDEKRRKVLQETENLRGQRNQKSKTKPIPEEIVRLRKVGEEIKTKEEELFKIENQLEDLVLAVPNLAFDEVPVANDESGNKVLKKWGTPKKFSFAPLDHVALGEKLDLIDVERGTKVAQSGFYFLKNEAALLEFALINYIMAKLVKKGFTPVVTPELVNEKIIGGTGYKARSEKERQIYKVEDEDLHLIATAEITLVGQHAQEIIDVKNLPIKYVGFSSCFRVERGSYGKDVRGILRVHEFDKVEMVAFCMPEDSAKLHDEFLQVEEEIFQDLEIPYQVLLICTGDLGSAAAKKYDVEAWMPSQNKYREVTSTSNTTDFQARRLNIKYKEAGKTEILHTLNGTACAIGRTLIAILENNQQEDGTVLIPKVLQPFLGKEKISR